MWPKKLMWMDVHTYTVKAKSQAGRPFQERCAIPHAYSHQCAKAIRNKINCKCKSNFCLHLLLRSLNWMPHLAGIIFFSLTWEVLLQFAGMNMSHDIVSRLVQFEFSYSSAIISAFIISLSALKPNPTKTICHL